MKKMKKQVQRKCKRCGVIFLVNPGSDRSYCSECFKDIKRESVLRERICATCGTTFLGYPRSKYCPTCKKEAMLQDHRRSNERQKNGTARKIGSTDICQNCGSAYTVVSGLQRYCPECARTVVNKNIQNHKRKYMLENRVEKGEQKKERRRNRRICVICGKVFDPKTCTNVCSPKCKKIRNSEFQKRADIKRGKYCKLYDTVAEASAAREKILKKKQEDDNVQGNQ